MNHLLKRSFSLLMALVMCLSLLPASLLVANAAEETATITFDNTSKRTVYTTAQQVWVENGITVTNNKGSGNNIADYSNPVRFYKNSELIISFAGGNMTKIVFTCSSSTYATAMQKSIGSTATASGSVVTLTLDTAAAEYKFDVSGGQTRVNSITVTYTAASTGGCAHANAQTVARQEPTCTEVGYEAGTYCPDCQAYIDGGAEIAATGHSFGDWSLTTAPSCSEPGEQTRVCANCDATETQAVATTDHVDANNDNACDVCGSSTKAWTLVTDSSVLKVNDQVIIVAADYDVALSTTQNSNNRGQTEVTKGTDVIEQISEAVQVLTLKAGNNDGTFAFYTGSGYLCAASSSSNYLRTETTLSDNSSWLITVADGVTSVVAQGSYTRNIMQYNQSSSLFACYGSASQKAVSLYYIPAPACTHPNMETYEAKDATCTEPGNTAGKYCPDCGYAEGYEEIEALGHAWDAGTVVAPTYSEDGYTAYKCTRCDATEQKDKTDALKYYNDVHFVVPEGVQTIASVTSGKAGIELPSAQCPEGYTFVGWTKTAVDSTETMPEKYLAGQTFKPTGETVLYALYSVGGSVETSYELKDISAITAADTVVITMTADDGTIYALNGSNGTSAAPAATIVTAENGKLTSAVTQELKWNLVEEGEGYAIYPQGDTTTWLYCTSSNNGTRVGDNANKIFTITNDYLHNEATGRYVGVYKSNPDWRCYTSINTNIQNQVLGFYVEAGAGVTTYTTAGAAAPKASFEVDGKEYVTLEAALRAHTEEKTYIKLLCDVTDDVTLAQNVYLDLAGFDWDGTITLNGNRLFGMDSTTDDYDCTDGYGTITQVAGNPELHHKTDVTGKIRRYLTYTDTNGAVSFHRIYLGVTHMSLRPSVEGVGYRATFCADSVATAMLHETEAFGYRLWIVDQNEAVVGEGTRYLAKEKFVNKAPVTLRLENFDVANYGEHKVCSEVYLKLADGTVIDSADYTYTLRSMLETISADVSKYSSAQMKSIQAMCLKFEETITEKQWAVENILAWEENQ